MLTHHLQCGTRPVQSPGVLQILSDRDDQNILEGLKFLILGFLGVGKFGKYLFGWLDFIRVFLGTRNSGPCGTPLASAFKRKMLFDFFKIFLILMRNYG